MADRYQRITLIVRTKSGVVAPGAEIAVYRKSDGALATLYSGDNLTGSVSNPVFASSSGSVTFYAGDLKDNYTFVPVDSNVVVSAQATADTVENHRQTGEHAAGTITADQLAAGIIGNTTDVAIHEAKVRGVHGVPTALGTEGFAYSTTGGTTNSPVFADVTATNGIVAGNILGETVVTSPTGTGLATAISAAITGDTLIIPAGVWTLSAGVTLNGIHLVGQGRHNTTLQLASGSGTVVTQGTGISSLRGLKITHSGSGDCLALGGSSFTLHDVWAAANSGTALSYTGGLTRFNATQCYFSSVSGSSVVVNGSGVVTGPWSMDSCWLDGDATFTAPTTNVYGGSITNCSFEDDLTVSTPNMRFFGNIVKGGITLNATAAPCLLPSNANYWGGTFSGQVYAEPFTGWDYISSWIDIDNSGSSKTDEYFLAGTSGIGSSVTHNLGSRQLEIMVQVANNSTGSDERWTVFGGPVKQVGNQVTPVLEAFTPHIINGNTINFVMYAGDHQTGSGTTASSSKTIFTAVDSQNLQAAARNAYNYGAAGGYALDRVWIRFFIRRAFGT